MDHSAGVDSSSGSIPWNTAAIACYSPLPDFAPAGLAEPALDTAFNATVSYGIRRREFDDYLLRRSGARLLEGISLASLQRDSGGWIVNGNMRGSAGGRSWRPLLPGCQTDGRETGARKRGWWRKRPSSRWMIGQQFGLPRSLPHAGALLLRRSQRLRLGAFARTIT